MKVKDIKENLQLVVEKHNFVYNENKVTNNMGQVSVSTSTFSNLNNFRNGLSIIESIGILKDEITKIKKTGIFTSAQDKIEIGVSEARTIKLQFDRYIYLVSNVYQSLTVIGGTTRENSISVKLSNIKDFDDLAKTSSVFHTILTQSIVNDEIKGKIQIDNVENGSIWLDIYLGSSAALTLIGCIAWSAAVIYKKINEGRIIEEHVKSLKIKNESIDEIRAAQKEVINMMIDGEARQLYKENFKPEENHEQIERLKHSIKLLSDQIEKGAEIHPALNTPESVSNLFPDMKHLELVESKIKKLKE